MKHYIIGRGRLGGTLEKSLLAVKEDIAKTIENADIVWITVPDSAITRVVMEIKNSLSEKHILVHCSGFFPASIMENSVTDNLVSLHPAYSFPYPLKGFPEGVFWTFEGKNSLFDLFYSLIEKWKGVVGIIESDKKPLYHTACVFASNFPIASLLMADEIFRELGIEGGTIFKSLVFPVFERLMEGLEVKSALTGPAKRKDMDVVKSEIEVLKEINPELSEVYALISRFILQKM